jgi:protein-disulfide isomerase
MIKAVRLPLSSFFRGYAHGKQSVLPMEAIKTKPKAVLAPTNHDHILGPRNAPVHLIEYGEYECPFCAKAEANIREVRKVIGGRFKFVFRHFPLVQLHDHALKAALAAEAAGLQGKFWEMHEMLFSHQHSLAFINIVAYAEVIGLDVDKFVKDTTDDKTMNRIFEHIQNGEEAGVKGKSFFCTSM